MITYKDFFGALRGIESTESSCGKFINLTLYTPTKHTNGSAIQIPKEVYYQFIDEEFLKLLNSKEKENEQEVSTS